MRRLMRLNRAAQILSRTARHPWRGPVLLLVTDDSRLPDPLAVAATLPPGSGLLLRHYDDPDRLGVAMALAALAKRRRLILLVAGDWRLAARLGAKGLHLPEGLARHGVLAPGLGWRRRRRVFLSVACHSPRALGRAAELGADVALLSPVFPTASHPGAVTIGASRFGLWRTRTRLPVLALGGMGWRGAARLPRGAAAGLAAIGGFTDKKG